MSGGSPGSSLTGTNIKNERINQVRRVLRFSTEKITDKSNLENGESNAETNIIEPNTEQNLITRKKKRCPSKWKKNIKKNLREKGETYIDNKGNLHAAKVIKPACNDCYLQCSNHFSAAEREILKKEFYSLQESKKAQYLGKFVVRKQPIRKRTKNVQSLKKNTFGYFFPKGNGEVKVCRLFFCKTLDISKTKIYYLHKKWQTVGSSIPPTPAKGKFVKRVTNPEKITEVMQHISSFPTEESHFCRSESKRKYLDRSLSISKMYCLYKESQEEPVKENIYRKIFTEKFNLSFYKPKKDVCDLCWEFKSLNQPNETQTEKHTLHLKRKEDGNNEREKDRNMKPLDVTTTAVICYDLENIFSLPKANISSFFYKSKLTVYNLTAHCNLNKNVYNSIWDETTNGRSGDDIASALMVILKRMIQDLPATVTKLILWSDSCVPQNRNSHMSVALVNFLKSENCGHVTKIEQKYSEPGHGNIQEVDSAHSLIERHIRHLEIFSPLSLLRSLKKIKSQKMHFVLFQMRPEDFLSYHDEAIKFSFNQIPYTKVKSIEYSKTSWNIIEYKLGFTEETKKANISNKGKIIILNDVQVKPPPSSISIKKIQDVQSLYKFMPELDKTYFQAIFRRFVNKDATQRNALLLTATENRPQENRSQQNTRKRNTTKKTQPTKKKPYQKETQVENK